MYFTSEFCFICLGLSKSLKDLIKTNPENKVLLEKLHLLVNEIEWNKCQHLFLCDRCITKLNNAYDFKKLILRSHDSIQKFIKHQSTINSNFNNVDPLKDLTIKNDIQQQTIEALLTNKIKNGIIPNNTTAMPGLISLTPDNKVFPTFTNIIVANTAQPNSFQNVFLNLIPTNVLNTITTANLDTNQNKSIVTKPVLKVPQIIKTKPFKKEVKELNVNQILTESKTEELSVDINPLDFDTLDNETTKEVNDWEDIISTNQIVSQNVETCINSNITSNDDNIIDDKQEEEIEVNGEITNQEKVDFFNSGHFLFQEPDEIQYAACLFCEDCGLPFDTVKNLRIHIKATHKSKFPYNCQYCFSDFAVKKHFDSHLKKHELDDILTLKDFSNKNPAAEELLQISSAKAQLKVETEKKIELDSKPGECKICHCVFTSQIGLLRHNSRRHKEKSVKKKYFIKGMKNAQCDICNRMFSTHSYLIQHKKLHVKGLHRRSRGSNKDQEEVEELIAKLDDDYNDEDISQVLDERVAFDESNENDLSDITMKYDNIEPNREFQEFKNNEFINSTIIETKTEIPPLILLKSNIMENIQKTIITEMLDDKRFVGMYQESQNCDKFPLLQTPETVFPEKTKTLVKKKTRRKRATKPTTDLTESEPTVSKTNLKRKRKIKVTTEDMSSKKLNNSVRNMKNIEEQDSVVKNRQEEDLLKNGTISMLTDKVGQDNVVNSNATEISCKKNATTISLEKNSTVISSSNNSTITSGSDSEKVIGSNENISEMISDDKDKNVDTALSCSDKSLEMSGPDKSLEISGVDKSLEISGLDKTSEISESDKILEMSDLEISGHDKISEISSHDKTLEMPGRDQTLEMSGPDKISEISSHDQTLQISDLNKTLEMSDKAEIFGLDKNLEISGLDKTPEISSHDKTFEISGCDNTNTERSGSDKTLDTRATSGHDSSTHSTSGHEDDEDPYKYNLVDGKPQCLYCLKLYSRKYDLKRHMNNVHLKSVQYVCHLCNRTFYEGFHLTRHLRSHYCFVTCHLCTKDFSYVVPELRNHLTHAHDNNTTGLCGSCGICKTDFTDLEGLKEHMDEHFKEIVYKCHLCPEEFRECRELSKHLVEHVGPYNCLSCRLVFESEQEWIAHNTKHVCMDMERFQCDQCSNTYKKRRYLKAHYKNMHGVKDGVSLATVTATVKEPVESTEDGSDDSS